MKFITISFIFLSSLTFAQPTSPLASMNNKRWEEDIKRLDKSIRDDFKSFDPSVQQEFAAGIAQLRQDIPTLDPVTITLRLTQLVGSLNDGHTEIQLHDRTIAFERLPISMYFFEEGLYLTGSHLEYKDLIGRRITAIGGINIDDVTQRLTTFMNHDNEYEILQSGPGMIILPVVMQYLGLTTESNTVTFTIENVNGLFENIKIQSKSIDDYLKGPWTSYRQEHHIKPPMSATDSVRQHWFKYLPEKKMIYFSFGTVDDQNGFPSLRKVTEQLFDLIDATHPDKLAIDLRLNRGGNYHKSRPLVEEILKRPWLNTKGKVFVITGRTTFSAAMITATMLRRETNALLVGEPSRGNPNKCENVEYLVLPNSRLRLEYTTRVALHWPEIGTANKIPIDLPVTPSFHDYSNGADACIDKILGN